MPVNSFKFVSPGIFLNEIDNSQIPQLPGAIGPTIIGRSTKGRAMHPIKIDSFSDFVDQFGTPVPGGADSDYRTAIFSGPTYGAYAAQAYLAAGIGPVNYIRLLGLPNQDATSAGYAGWTTYRYTAGSLTAKTYADNAGAIGLFVAPSASSAPHPTGTLAAVFYLTNGGITLSGTFDGGTIGAGTNKVMTFAGDSATTDMVLEISSSTGGSTTKVKFNLDRDSARFARNVFNTNPVMTNDGVIEPSSLTQKENIYWLGETYETQVEAQLTGTSGKILAWLAPVASGSLTAGSLTSYGEMRFSEANTLRSNNNIIDGRTGWFFSQDLSSNTASYSYDGMIKLFRFHGLDAGEWTQKNIKVSIDNVAASPNEDVEPFGRFSVVVRNIRDTDANPIVLERFDNLSLNPASPDYIGVRIGDKTRRFSYIERVNREYGQFDNQSRYIRVEVNPAVESALVSPKLLPFGVYGPIRPKRINALTNATTDSSTFISRGTWPKVDNINFIVSSSAGTSFTASILFPGTSQRISASEGSLTDSKKAFFGIRTTVEASSNRYDASIPDTLRLYGTITSQNVGLSGLAATDPFEYQWIFSLDEVVTTGTNNKIAYYQSGSRASGVSNTAVSSTGNDENQSGYISILRAGYDKYTTVFQGGSDGLNIQEAEPFQYNRITSGVNTSNSAYNTLEVAIDLAADPDMLETNLITVPGVRDETLTTKIITTCENRADALALIDIDDGYKATTEDTSSFKDRLGSVTTAVVRLRARKINSSYACTYYPWVQIRDSLNGTLLWVPPSVAILGTMASSERVSEVWFAPAGFNRGGLSSGAAGIPVVNVAEKLTSKQRDSLYAANINPIASFPAEGIVVFGQKTLQVTPSALDRINVRRLMIYIKKQVSRFATTVLFDQNVEVTWNRFKSAVEPFLASVQSRLGLTEYKVILDSTTTTPDLVDRNILYAKIFLKPARAIEFIAVDFVISRTGASFED